MILDGVHTKKILASEDLSCVKVYELNEMTSRKFDEQVLQICKEEKVKPEEYWLIDDFASHELAQSLNMSVVKFDRPTKFEEAAKSINACRDQLLTLDMLHKICCIKIMLCFRKRLNAVNILASLALWVTKRCGFNMKIKPNRS